MLNIPASNEPEIEMNPSQIIDALGGTAEVAKLCKVKPPSVSQWRESGIPQARLMFLKLARPDVFQIERKANKKAA